MHSPFFKLSLSMKHQNPQDFKPVFSMFSNKHPVFVRKMLAEMMSWLLLDGWLVGWLASWLVAGWMVGRPAGWWLAGCWVADQIFKHLNLSFQK